MRVDVRSLADFRRFLSHPSATVQVVRNDWSDPTKVPNPIRTPAGYFEPKKVKNLLGKSVQFTTGSWLDFPRASNMRFDGDTVTVDLDQNGHFDYLLVYKLWEDLG